MQKMIWTLFIANGWDCQITAGIHTQAFRHPWSQRRLCLQLRGRAWHSTLQRLSYPHPVLVHSHHSFTNTFSFSPHMSSISTFCLWPCLLQVLWSFSQRTAHAGRKYNLHQVWSQRHGVYCLNLRELVLKTSGTKSRASDPVGGGLQ